MFCGADGQPQERLDFDLEEFGYAPSRCIRGAKSASETMGDVAQRGRLGQVFRSAAIVLAVTIATLAALEILLRVADFRELREGVNERSLSYRHDPELGWFPAPNSSSVVTNARTIHVQHNSLGLRDIEFVPDGRPTILFLGDSFVWGLDAEADERFTELLRHLSHKLSRRCFGIRHRPGVSVAVAAMADDKAGRGDAGVLYPERSPG